MGKRLHKSIQLCTVLKHFNQKLLLHVWMLNFIVYFVHLWVQVGWKISDLFSVEQSLYVIIEESLEIFFDFRLEFGVMVDSDHWVDPVHLHFGLV